MTEGSLLAAFLVGLLGGVHCVGMCGGIVGALTLGLRGGQGGRAPFPYLLAYNAGRLASYGLAGLLAGGLVLAGGRLLDLYHLQAVLGVVAGVFMVLLGLYLGGWWRVLSVLERAGARLWRHIEPLGRGLLPVTSPLQALGLGMVWGWLPCGLVYSVLVWAMSAGSMLGGGLLMLSFGLGTLPTLLAMGTLAAQLGAAVRRPWVRHLAGVAIAGLGLLQIGRAL